MTLSPAAIASSQPDARERFALLVSESQKADDALNPMGLAERGLAPTAADFVDPQSEAFAGQLATNKRAELSRLAGIDRASLAGKDQIAYDAFRYQAEQALGEIDSGIHAIRNLAPLNASFGLQVEFPDYLSGVRFKNGRRLRIGTGPARGFRRATWTVRWIAWSRA